MMKLPFKAYANEVRGLWRVLALVCAAHVATMIGSAIDE